MREIRYIGPASEHIPDSARLEFVIEDLPATTARASVVIEAETVDEALQLAHRLLHGAHVPVVVASDF